MKFELVSKSDEEVVDVLEMHDIDIKGAKAYFMSRKMLEEKDFDKLDEPTEEEEDMLDLAHGLTHTSRLGCQIIMTEDLDGLKIKVPSGTRNINVE